MSDGLTDDPWAPSRGRSAFGLGGQSHGITSSGLTAAATDGNCIFAVRYASDDRAPTLYIGHSSPDGKADERGPAVMVLSEPLDSDASDWREVEMS